MTAGHTVEKIGGTSMSRFDAVLDNVLCGPRRKDSRYRRIFVVSAYGGITDRLLEHKRTGEPGVYALFANADADEDWEAALEALRHHMLAINADLFDRGDLCDEADRFIGERIDGLRRCLLDLQRVCRFGQFQLDEHLLKVREMLASLGEAHSAWNSVALLRERGVAARFVDLSGWRRDTPVSLDRHILDSLAGIDFERELPVVTGYAYCSEGLMKAFDRGYSEMTFSRIAVLTGAREAIIHKEFHLSSADPRIVGADRVVPIGRTNYDLADQLANVGMEAIHPKAAKGLRQADIPLRVKSTFEPDHDGTLFTRDYSSDTPRVEIISGRRHVFALQLFDQDMTDALEDYDHELIATVKRFRARILTKDLNANTITHYVDASLKTVKRIVRALEERYPDAEVTITKVALISIVGSRMHEVGALADTLNTLSRAGVRLLALHQCIRQVDIQCIVAESDYVTAVRALHAGLIETGASAPAAHVA